MALQWSPALLYGAIAQMYAPAQTCAATWSGLICHLQFVFGFRRCQQCYAVRHRSRVTSPDLHVVMLTGSHVMHVDALCLSTNARHHEHEHHMADAQQQSLHSSGCPHFLRCFLMLTNCSTFIDTLRASRGSIHWSVVICCWSSLPGRCLIHCKIGSRAAG